MDGMYFIEQAGAAHRFVIESADVALDKAVNRTVRDLARHLREDHARMQEDLRQVAAVRDIIAVGALTPDQQLHLRRLQLDELVGGAFESVYLEQQRQAHADAAALFERAAAELDGPLAALAARELPVLRAELDEVRVAAAPPR